MECTEAEFMSIQFVMVCGHNLESSQTLGFSQRGGGNLLV
jgi:hypothetical protein